MTKSRCLKMPIIAIIGIVISMWLMRFNPVLFVLLEKGPLLPRNLIFVQNPFRDRGPERAAENFLDNLKGQDFSIAFESLEDSPQEYLDNARERDRIANR